MFEAISNSLDSILRKLKLKGRLSEANIKDAMRQIRLALLEADVNYKVVKDFIARVTEKAVGAEVIKSVSPGQMVVKIVHDELIDLMGPVEPGIPFSDKGLTVIMMAGLQGSGKTTTCGKLSRFVEKAGHHPLMVAADVKRPAAVEQLKMVGDSINVPVYSESGQDAVGICKRSVKYAKGNDRDTIILDTAGRLHIDAQMMDELRQIQKEVKPNQIYLVCDAMTGQDAVTSAQEFNDQLELDGVILTKLDGDTRGGAALSVKAVTGKPIKFIGIGEKLDKLEEFYPDRMANRILGMADVVTLVEKAQDAISEEEAIKMQEKFLKNAFTFDDFLKQLQAMKKMGPFKDILGHLGLGAKLQGVNIDENQFTRTEAIIQSMTPRERNFPEVIDSSRRMRIARGSGTTTAHVNELLKNFRQMKSMMKRMKGGDIDPAMLAGGGAGGMQKINKSKFTKKRKKRKKRKK